MMEPRERYDALFTGEKIDCLPRIPILMQFAAEYIGSHYGAFASDYKVLVEANLRCAQDFGFDQLSCISDPYREASGFGSEIRFHENSVPECVRPALDDIDDIGTLKLPDPFTAPRMLDRIKAVRAYREQIGDRYSVLGWVEGPAALAGDLRELSEFLMDIIEEPEASGELLDICTQAGIDFALAQIEAGADTIGVGEAICSQVSPDIYKNLIVPRELKLMQAIKDAGAKVRLHICGQTEHLWPHMQKLPIDIIDCDHMVNLEKAAKALPNSVFMVTNLDPVTDLRFGTPEAIRTKLKSCADAVSPRLLIGAGCEIPSGTPVENLNALCSPLKSLSYQTPVKS